MISTSGSGPILPSGPEGVHKVRWGFLGPITFQGLPRLNFIAIWVGARASFFSSLGLQNGLGWSCWCSWEATKKGPAERAEPPSDWPHASIILPLSPGILPEMWIPFAFTIRFLFQALEFPVDPRQTHSRKLCSRG